MDSVSPNNSFKGNDFFKVFDMKKEKTFKQSICKSFNLKYRYSSHSFQCHKVDLSTSGSNHQHY